ncbi:MAG: hypothetical protein ACE5HN_10300 [Nitrospiria bacterium]
MFRRIFAILILPFLLLIIPLPVATAKPRPPLQLTLRQGDLSGEEVQLTLKARANVESSRVILSIDLPPSLTFIEGEETWEGPLKRGETKKIEVTILNPGNQPQEITGKGTIQFANGGTFVQQNTLMLSGPKKEPPPRPHPIERKEGGETILEFRGK